MARDWNDETATLSALEARMDRIAPGNISPLPISSAKEQDIHGEWAWTVDLHVKIPGVTEYDVTGVGRTLAGALRRAYLGLNNEASKRLMADAANRAFGIVPALTAIALAALGYADPGITA